MIHSNSRGVYVSFVNKARKDNSVCKKGESYIRVKKNQFSAFELFRTLDDLDKKYPRTLVVSEPELRRILDDFKEVSISSKEFLLKYFEL